MDRDHAILNELRIVRIARFVVDLIEGVRTANCYHENYDMSPQGLVAASEKVGLGFTVHLIGESDDRDNILAILLSYLGEPVEWVNQFDSTSQFLLWTHQAYEEALGLLTPYQPGKDEA